MLEHRPVSEKQWHAFCLVETHQESIEQVNTSALDTDFKKNMYFWTGEEDDYEEEGDSGDRGSDQRLLTWNQRGGLQCVA